MYQWVDAPNDHHLLAACGTCHVPQGGGGSESLEGNTYRFAVAHGETELRLYMDLASDASSSEPPEVRLLSGPADWKLETTSGALPGRVRLCLVVPSAGASHEDDELTAELGGDQVAPCRVVVRRTTCKISTALLGRGHEAQPLWPYTRAAILWCGWGRYREMVGLKRFTEGKSESEVLVFQPKLRDPKPVSSVLKGSCIPNVVSESWGSCILVKTGRADKIREEWDRFHTFLVDRLHPFMARSEAFLAVRPEGQPPGDSDRESGNATIIGSFLGGDLLQAEPLKMLVRQASEFSRCGKAMERLFALMAPWYEGSRALELKQWSKMFELNENKDVVRFCKKDLSKKADLEKFAAFLDWDVAFVKGEHLSRHLLGKNGDGLLHLLAKMPVRYSLTHGDLHPSNVLADSDNVWLLDFGDTGVAPTLFDFAKLEVYLRLWCLDMAPGVRDLETAAMAFETQLLDHMMRTEGSLGGVRELAPSLGVSPDALLNTARCISLIRRHAARYCIGGPDHRDYLAVLFLTVLHTLQFAGRATEYAENFRLLVGLFWLLEDTLSVLHGMEPYDRERVAMEPTRLISRNWLAAPGAPARVVYLMSRSDGQAALEPLAATRGVLQSQKHHLDVFDHTLLVLAYLEDLLSDPVGGLLDPSALDRRVMQALREQGVLLPAAPPPPHPATAENGPHTESELPGDVIDELRELFNRVLDEDTRLLLKWATLFHDVGKPATRTVNVHSRGSRERVQFLGHEIYGQHLVRSHVQYLYPEEDRQARFNHLVKRHHDHHNIINRYQDSGLVGALKNALSTHDLPPRELKFLSSHMSPEDNNKAADFPLLILHGFADVLACRGPDTDLSMTAIARIDLILLTLFARYPRFLHREEMERKFRELSSGMDVRLGLTGPPLGKVLKALKEWFMAQTCPATYDENGPVVPQPEQVLEQAKKLRDDLGLVGEPPTAR